MTTGTIEEQTYGPGTPPCPKTPGPEQDTWIETRLAEWRAKDSDHIEWAEQRLANSTDPEEVETLERYVAALKRSRMSAGIIAIQDDVELGAKWDYRKQP
jgi:hypothetical protein